MLLAHQITDGQITQAGLQWFKEQLLLAGHINQIDLEGMSESRRDVIVGGYCILQMLFNVLGLEGMSPIGSALLRRGDGRNWLGAVLGKTIAKAEYWLALPTLEN